MSIKNKLYTNHIRKKIAKEKSPAWEEPAVTENNDDAINACPNMDLLYKKWKELGGPQC